MRTRIFFALIAVSAAAYACGGVDSDLVGNGSDSGEGDDDAASSTRHDAGTRDASISGNDASTASDGGVVIVKDAGVKDSGVHDGGVVVHPGVVPAVCGTEPDAATLTCATGTPTCCANQSGTQTDFSCAASPTFCTGLDVVAVQCRDDRDCPGAKVCCGQVASTYSSVMCLDSCPETDDAGNSFLRFCTPGETDSECVEYGGTCTPSSLLPGFNHC